MKLLDADLKIRLAYSKRELNIDDDTGYHRATLVRESAHSSKKRRQALTLICMSRSQHLVLSALTTRSGRVVNHRHPSDAY
jgi:hypothetical protein